MRKELYLRVEVFIDIILCETLYKHVFVCIIFLVYF